jgi:glycosyltransferase involved in cell wall biosynthesis
MVIPTGIDIENYRNIPSKGHFREKFNIPKEKKIVLFVGRLDPIKGIDILIEAFADIEDEKCLLVIIGPDHGFQNEINRLVKKYELENKVIITGALPDHKDVLSAMNDANVIVVPSRAEAFGMVILEGAVLRKPMVISKNCNISDQFEDSALVTEIKSESIGEAINNILNDHAFGRDLGEKAYNKVVEKFQLSRVVDEFEILFSKLITADGR